MVVDTNYIELGGPLHGLLSIHLLYPTEATFILACDLPNMSAIVLKTLFENYKNDIQKEAWVFVNGKEAEPLCDIYSPQAFAKILALYNTQQLPKHSMKYTLDHLTVSLLPLSSNWEHYFKNFNSQNDFGIME